MPTSWTELSARLTTALHLSEPAVAITFHDGATHEGVPAFDAAMPAPTADGRTGRVPAGCAFWSHGAEATFTTVAADHANCSVGSTTHGFTTLDEVAGNDDVAALVGSGWIRMEDVPSIPVVRRRPSAVMYGPLSDTPVDPDVVLVKVNGKQLMVLSDALPDLRIEGKPQCHIVAVAKEQGVPAASVGCMLSRTRTAMPSEQMTCALPAAGLADVVEAIEATAATDAIVARYAAEDARRFSTSG